MILTVFLLFFLSTLNKEKKKTQIISHRQVNADAKNV